MRILIVGAGIGGLTLAALLERWNIVPVVVERAPDFEHAGYMLSLYSLGSRVLHGLGLFDRFVESGIAADQYAIHDDRGRLVKQWSLAPINDRFGPTISSTRPDLVTILHEGLQETQIRFGLALQNVEQANGSVRAEFSDGSSATFDVVVGADGMHSRVRKAVFGEQPEYATGWGGWVWWADGSQLPPRAFVEFWGAGRLLGTYPTRRGAGVFAGAPIGGDFDHPGAGRGERLRRRFAGLGPAADSLLDGLPGDDAELFFWRLSDVRSRHWLRGRVVLLGDAAAGFLPTAGIGASMAMESAAVLADELSRSSLAHLDHALALYVKRRKRRVERMQRDSRRLGRLMFLSSPALAAARNFALRFYSLNALVKNIAKAFETPI